MKVTNDKTENNETYLTIEMDPAEIEESQTNVYRKLVKQVNIPGFRKGKAPRPVLERFVGQERLVNDMLDDLVPRAYEKAIDEQQLEAISQPKIEILETDPVKFQAVVPLKPVISLGDYHKIEVTEEPVEVTDETVDRVVEELRHQHSTWEPVEHAVELNNVLTLEVESTMEGEPFINQKSAQYQVLADSPAPAPGFAEQLLEMNKGDEKEFQLKFPEDYAQKELAGKEVSFKVSILEIKEENLPEVNDEFATQVDAEIENVEKLRERIFTDLKNRAEERAQKDFEDKAVESLVEISDIQFPPVMTDYEVHQLMNDQERRLQSQGLSMEQMLRSSGKTEEEMHDEFHPVAEKRVAQSLALGKLTEAESIVVEESDIDIEIAETMKNFPSGNTEQLEKAFSSEEARNSIRQVLLTRWTLKRLVDIVKGSEDTETPKKEEK